MAGETVGGVLGRVIGGIGGALCGGCSLEGSGGGGGGGGVAVGERCGGFVSGACLAVVVLWGNWVMLDVVLSDGEC